MRDQTVEIKDGVKHIHTCIGNIEKGMTEKKEDRIEQASKLAAALGHRDT